MHLDAAKELSEIMSTASGKGCVWAVLFLLTEHIKKRLIGFSSKMQRIPGIFVSFYTGPASMIR